jgi:ASTRA-associated protein 1
MFVHGGTHGWLRSDYPQVDLISLPSGDPVGTIPAPTDVKTGMAMALSVSRLSSSLLVIAAYESGHTAVFHQTSSPALFERIYLSRPHSQPILSLAPSPCLSYYLSSSADAIIAKHPLPTASRPLEANAQPLEILDTKHSGQQGLRVRSDGRIFATAGWDSRVRVYAARTMREVAVLKWHRDGCYAVAFASVQGTPEDVQRDPGRDGDGETTAHAGEAASAPPASTALASLDSSITVAQRREQRTRSTHWLAAGSKDGKISLWDIY